VSEGRNGEIVIEYGGSSNAPSGSLVSIRVVSGAGFTDLGAQRAGYSQRIAFAGDAGFLEVTVRIDAAFVGQTGLSFYIPGTGIVEPSGTVSDVRTDVAP
jgi:hypothetical protein